MFLTATYTRYRRKPWPLQGEPIPMIARFDVAPGDELTIETPGGGGYGARK